MWHLSLTGRIFIVVWVLLTTAFVLFLKKRRPSARRANGALFGLKASLGVGTLFFLSSALFLTDVFANESLRRTLYHATWIRDLCGVLAAACLLLTVYLVAVLWARKVPLSRKERLAAILIVVGLCCELTAAAINVTLPVWDPLPFVAAFLLYLGLLLVQLKQLQNRAPGKDVS